MAKRFTAEFDDIDGQEYRINIFDDNYAGASVEQDLTCAVPGFDLSYESEPDQPYQGIISSTLTCHLINDGGAFDTWLQNIPSLTGENDVTITLEWKDGSIYDLEWAGVVMVDQIEIEDMPTPSRVKLVANDGISFLKTIRGTITETNANSVDVLSSNSVINWLQEILTNTKSSVHWEAGSAFIRAWTDFKPENFGNNVANGGQGTNGLNVLDYTQLSGAFDPNTINVIDGTPEAYSDWTFLQSICMLFNARLCLANGEWHFWPVNQHLMEANGDAYTYDPVLYSKAGVELNMTQQQKGEFYSRTTPQLGPGTTANRYVQLSGGNISHTVPLKNFRRARPYRSLEWLNNSIRVGGGTTMHISVNGFDLVDFDAPQSFFTGAQFLIDGSIQVTRAAQSNSGYSGPASIVMLRIKCNLDVGSYRYNPANSTWVTDQTTDQFFFIEQIGTINQGMDVSVPFQISTVGLPDDSETLSCDIDADFINGVGQSLNSLFDDSSPVTFLGCFITTSLQNDAFQNQLLFQGETSLDNTEPFNQGNLVFGTVDSLGSNSGQLQVLNQYFATTVNWDMGSWVSHFSTDGAHINRLCVREAIALMQAGLPKRSGQIKIPGTMRIPSPLMTIQDEAGTGYFMVTSITYSSDQRLATVDRLQVNALDLTNVSDNGDEGQGTDGDGNDGSGSGGDGGGATDDDGSGGGGSGTSPNGGGTKGPELSGITEHVLFDKDGLIKLKAKAGELPVDADEIDDSSSTKKFATAAEKQSISDLKDALKTTTGSGGKGVFVQATKNQAASHVAVDSTTAKMQAGQNTQVDMSETSPGIISLKVQAGATGSEASVTAVRIQGDANFQNAQTRFLEPVLFSSQVSGISSSQVTEGSKLFHTNARVDARINAASIEDLSDVAAMTPTTNQVLQWNGSTWTAGTVSSGGGGAVDSVNGQTGTVVLDTGDLSEDGNLFFTDARVAANSAVAANTAKSTFPGFGTTAGTALEGNTSLLQLGTSSTTALAGDTNVITSAERTKLSGIATGAEVNVQSDWTASSGDAQILNKPSIPQGLDELTGNTDEITEGQENLFFSGQERTKLTGIAAGAEVNVVTTNLGSADQTLSGARSIDTDGNTLSIKDGNSNLLQYNSVSDIWEVSKPMLFTNTGGYTAGEVRLMEAPAASGAEYIALKAPGNVTTSVTFTLPDQDGSAGQFIKTDGSGTLSFASAAGGGGGMTELPFFNTSGRFVWSSADDGERILLGSSYGPSSFYSHSLEPSDSTWRVYSADTINSTTETAAAYFAVNSMVALPTDSKKVRAKITYRVQNGNSGDFGFSMWSVAAAPDNGSTANQTVTLRAASPTTTVGTSSIATYTDEFTTTSALSGGGIYFLAEHRSGSLTTTTYMYFNLQLYLID